MTESKMKEKYFNKDKLYERTLVEILKTRLSPRYERILVHQNLANLINFRHALIKRLGYLPVLNEIDMVLVRREGHLCAIEIKYFDVKRGSFTRPFYDGIGQALTLLRYGFDYVALWHLFSNTIEQDRFDRYGAGTWWFLHKQTGLPLDFTYFKLQGPTDSPDFIVMQYTEPGKGVELQPIDSAKFLITWTHENPFRYTEEGNFLRKALADALGIGDLVK